MTKYKKVIYWIVFWLGLVFIFAVSATYLLLNAYGYKINLKAKKIQKTGLLVLKSTPKDVQIFINGKLKSQKTPYRQAYLLPGYYQAEIKKENYLTWQKSVLIESDKVADYAALLFFENPKITTEVSEQNQKLLTLNLTEDKVKVKDSELWLGEKFITRFSQKIEKALFYPDEEHIIFQIENVIRVIELDGSNNMKLVEGKKITNFALTPSGKTLIFEDEGKILQTQIR